MDANQLKDSVPVVLHYRDGRTTQYYSVPRIEREREAILVSGQGIPYFEVPFSALKAIFFLKGNSDTAAGPDDKATSLVVEFQDGEKIRGLSDEYHPDRNGFFLFPVDRSKNDRIFVVNAAIVSVEVDRP
jgi:hypothetical protein